MFFVKDGQTIKKYKIEIDKETLGILRLNIINDCSLITHVKEKIREDRRYDYDNLFYRNYSEKFIERIDNNDFFGSPTIDIYEVIYDRYEPPDIIELIDNVLAGNEDSSIELLNYNPPVVKDIQIQIDELLKDTSDLDKLQANIEKVNELINQKEVNKNQKDVSVYLLDVKACIKVILVEEIDYEFYIKACKFLDDSKTLVDKEKICIKA